MKILYDSDVLLDVLLARPEFHDASLAALDLAATGHEGYIAAHAVTNLYYIIGVLDESLKNTANKSHQIKQKLASLLINLSVSPVNQEVVEMALSSSMKDFEDAVCFYAALNSGVDLLVTRNISHYPQGQDLSVVLPSASTCLTNSPK